MSLVGNLSDLGLGEIMQIVSLSRKSGTLQLATSDDSGAIVLLHGRVVAAHTEAAEENVGEALLRHGVIAPSQYQEMLAIQADEGAGDARFPPVLWERFGIDGEAVSQAVRSEMEAAVYRMFFWEEGNFSFALNETDAPPEPLALRSKEYAFLDGVNPQWLAMEGARIKDERGRENPVEDFLKTQGDEESAIPSPDDVPLTSNDLFGDMVEEDLVTSTPDEMAGEIAAPAVEELDSIGEDAAGRSAGNEGDIVFDLADPAAGSDASIGAVDPPPETAPPVATAGAVDLEFTQPSISQVVVDHALGESDPRLGSIELVIIDDDLLVLKQMKALLQTAVSKVHTFSRVDEGLKGIRQLLWADRKVVVVADLIIARSDGSGILGGLEVLEKIRPDFPDLPVIVATDYENDDAKLRADELGVSAFLNKPRKSEISREEVGDEMLSFVGEVRDTLSSVASGVVSGDAHTRGFESDEGGEGEAAEQEAAVEEPSAELVVSESAPVVVEQPSKAIEVIDEHVQAPIPVAPEEQSYRVVSADFLDNQAEAAVQSAPDGAAQGEESSAIEEEPEESSIPESEAAEDRVESPVEAISEQPIDSSFSGEDSDEVLKAGEIRVVELGGDSPAEFSLDEPRASLDEEVQPQPEPPQEVREEIEAAAAEVAATDGATYNLASEIIAELGDEDTAIATIQAMEDVSSPTLSVLKSMLAELNDPANKETVTLLVLRYASEVMQRAALFLVTRDASIGLGGFSSAQDNADFVRRVRTIRLPKADKSRLDEVIQYRMTYHGPPGSETGDQKLYEHLGIRPTEIFIAPVISNARVAAVLYGDNAGDDEPLGDVQGLEIFITQAGMAMERALLERKLREAQKRLAKDPGR